jgi:glutaconyl-CoA decarboxylase
MKMQNEIGSPAAGTVKSVNVAAGESVKPGQIMVVLG